MRSNLNFLFALLVVILIVTIALASRGCGGPRVPKFIDPMLTVEEAEGRSSQSGKPVFVVVGADWSGDSDSFKRRTLSDSKLVAFLRANTEPVYFDATRSDKQDAETLAVMSRLGVSRVPSVVLIRRGQGADCVEGDVSAADLLKWLQDSLKPGAPTGR